MTPTSATTLAALGSPAARLRFSLLGTFQARHDNQPVAGPPSRKASELLCYLLVFRDRPHHRDVLSDALWGATAGTDARKMLRQALWQVNRSLALATDEPGPIEADDTSLWLNRAVIAGVDLEDIEHAYARVKGVPGEAIDERDARTVRDAVDLYQADLLVGWYQEWTVFERQRLNTMHLSLLDKLLARHASRGEYELGLACGQELLRHDRAHERTHVRMMRLHYLSGDRTSAIRQFAACARALDEELGVLPAARTVALHEDIRTDRYLGEQPDVAHISETSPS